VASREKAPRLIASERAVLGRDEWAFSRGQRVGAPLTSGDNAYSCLLLMTIPEFQTGDASADLIP